MPLVDFFESALSSFEKREEARRLLQVNMQLFALDPSREILRVNGPYMHITGTLGQPGCKVIYTANVEYHNRDKIPL